jgi:hypothetical protein
VFNQLLGIAKVVIDARAESGNKDYKELAQLVGGIPMKARVVIAAMLLMISNPPGSATVRISDDHGGRIGDYLAKYQALRLSGERVAIDGICASACTMILGALPRNRICVTPQATLQFHAAWDSTPGGNQVSSAGSRLLWSSYPHDVRNWISRHGGLGLRTIYLRGSELSAMYPRCR